jgi:hypothetical protein
MKFQYVVLGALTALACGCGPIAEPIGGGQAQPDLCSNSSDETAQQCAYRFIGQDMCAQSFERTKLADSEAAFVECIDEGKEDALGRRKIAVNKLAEYHFEVRNTQGHVVPVTFVAPAPKEDFNKNGVKDWRDCLNASAGAYDVPTDSTPTSITLEAGRACD